MVFDMSQLKITHTQSHTGELSWPGAAPSSLAKQVAGWVLFLALLELGPRYSPGSAQGREAGVRTGVGSVHADRTSQEAWASLPSSRVRQKGRLRLAEGHWLRGEPSDLSRLP